MGIFIKTAIFRRLAAGTLFLCVAAALTPTTFSTAQAATPQDNDELQILMNSLFATIQVSEVTGLAPAPLGPVGEASVLAANIGLKGLAPVFEAPADIEVLPDSFDSCSYNLDITQQTGHFENWYAFWNIRTLDQNWGELGIPTVNHVDTGVEVELVGYPAGVHLLDEGRHTMPWAAHTQISDFWDIYLPSGLLAIGTGVEVKRGTAATAKATGATLTKAQLLKRTLVERAKSLGQDLGLRGIGLLTNNTDGFLGDERRTSTNRDSQIVTVWDQHPPYYIDPDSGAIIETQTITVEAEDFGGVRFARVQDFLKQSFATIDDCGRVLNLGPDSPPSLLPVSNTGEMVTWFVQDDGPYQVSAWSEGLAANQSFIDDTAEEGIIRTQLAQRVIVQDTRPPLLVPPRSFARESDTPLTVNENGFSLGQPRVVDRADPKPVVSYRRVADDPDEVNSDELDYGRHVFEWTATDFSGNSTDNDGSPLGRYSQTITIKPPDTNTPPIVSATDVSGRTAEAITIEVTGNDADIVAGIADPLTFRLIDRPKNGTFRAPPTPFFIEDFRLVPDTVPGGDTPDCLEGEDRRSGTKLEAVLGQLDPFSGARTNYIERCYCEMPDYENLDEGEPLVPVDFVFRPQFVQIEDSGDYVVNDFILGCSNNEPGDHTTTERFSRWTDGEFIAQHLTPINRPEGPFDIDAEGRLWWQNQDNSENVLYFFSVDRDFERWKLVNGNPVEEVLRINDDSHPLISADQLRTAHADVDRGLIYTTDRRRVFVFPIDGATDRPALGTLKDNESFLTNFAPNGDPNAGFTLDTDSHGNLYVADSRISRIHQFEPSSLTEDGELAAGAYVGWLGRCTGNLIAPGETDPSNHCDVANQASAGFACTDETCDVEGATTGSGPAQFDQIFHFSIDPNDVLYVADHGNRRIQRFSAGGVFAGEAVSSGNGAVADGGFVLGNMGRPRHVAVNSDQFHVLEAEDTSSDYFLHIFKTLPFYDVTDSSAKLDYVSNFNFQGSDSFTLIADDGIAVSEPDTVTVNVERTFRAPESLTADCYANNALAQSVPCTLFEDSDIIVRLSASDPDGFIGAGGLDAHTFSIETDPANGTLSAVPGQPDTASSTVRRYTPNPDFNGEDSLTFQAFDGVDQSDVAGAIHFTIQPTNDPVEIRIEDEDLTFPRGFKKTLTATFADVDADPDQSLRADSWNWGDGVVAERSGWVGIGVEDENGDPVSPQRDTVPVEGFLIGAHTYDLGSHRIEICMVEENTDIIGCEQTGVLNIVEVTSVTTTRVGDATVQPNQNETITLAVRNELPSNWEGFAVDNGELVIELPTGTALLSAPANCTDDETGTVRCALILSQGEQALIALDVEFDLQQAVESPYFEFVLEVLGDEPRLLDRNRSSFMVEASDADGDGTIDAVDAFPDDNRYANDADEDGLPDSWEDANGYSSTNAGDANQDEDGDGFNTLTEFELGGTPRLADAYLKAGILNTGLESNDRFGFALASADFNGDGFEDLVLAAPSAGDGHVYLSYGSTNGAGPLSRVDDSKSDFGRAVAAGDLDGDGFGDVVVASSDRATVYYGSANGTQSGVKAEFSDSQNTLGSAVLVTDIDGDGNNDLLISNTAGTGVVTVFLGNARDWRSSSNSPDVRVTSGLSTSGFGVSLASGDIDADGLPDLLVGSDANQGFVYGFLGADVDWNLSTLATTSFRITGETGGDRFGFSIASDSDIDGDSIDDVLVGAYRAGSGGSAYVYASSTVDWRDNPTFTQRLDGEQTNEQFGVRVGLLAPSGNRTTADLLVGANRGEQGNAPDQGSMYHYIGGSLPVTPGVVDRGSDYDMLGYFVIGTADINGDGANDFIAGAPDIETGNRVSDGGYVQVYYGGAAPAQTDNDGDNVADALDNCPNDANETQSNGDNDSAGDACDDFPDDERYIADSDGDGLPNAYETDNGLNPNDPSDAAGDLDGDGRSNLEEYEQGFDPTQDDVAPELTAPANVTVNSTGPLTPVQLGSATALDARDGALMPTNDASRVFAPGRHVVYWQVQDMAGNLAEATQRVDVIPQLAFTAGPVIAGEGQHAVLTVELNGQAPVYPVTATVVFSGDAVQGSDYTLPNGAEIRIESGLTTQLMLAVNADGSGESDEDMTASLTSVNGAVAGPTANALVRITEGNVLPSARLQASQANTVRSTFYRDAGTVTLNVSVTDPDSGATQLIDWSASDNALVPGEGFFSTTFSFEPAGLTPGLYTARVVVTDSASLLNPVQRSLLFRVMQSTPQPQPGIDSDADGIADVDETVGDSDLDRLANELDASDRTNLNETTPANARLVQVEPGLRLVLGNTAYAAGRAHAISPQDVIDFGDAGQSSLNANDSATYPAGLVDFEIHGLTVAGGSARVVIPQTVAIPNNAEYRKFSSTTGWQTFEQTSGDRVASAPGTAQSCPAPGSSDYTPGLTAGDYCVELTITDGGPNDADGNADGVIRDPGGVAVLAALPLPGVLAFSNETANISVGTGARDVLIQRFTINTDSPNTQIEAITLNARGSGNDANDITEVILWLDSNANGRLDSGDQNLGTAKYSQNNGQMVLTLGSAVTLALGNNDFLVTYSF
ncbi:MAG: FG-GAP-like repeat-containing protein [Gammaproteobacteria bacterium]